MVLQDPVPVRGTTGPKEAGRVAGNIARERETSSAQASTKLREELGPQHGTEHRLHLVLH